ncbi:MAG: septal ring lytic transglycosylase RlpA family protein [Rhodospirillales bacterium]|nr:septal ring lytic transglycosylase RlpA family protein [Alphaproteobacteria bacterium]MBL6948748.1 septal ring lytic transglycosylase RlpA family protein [Rhodospirillales bacterium]
MSGSADESQSPNYKVGDPYQIQGVWYYPAEDYDYEETGIASWYGAQFHGRRTANGETYDMNALTAAHRTLPMPSYVRVTNLQNGRSLILKVNDRGPFARNRIIDISRRGSQLLGFQNAGTARVRVQIMADKSRALAVRVKGRTQLAQAGSPITVDRLPKPNVSTESLALPPGGKTAPEQARQQQAVPPKPESQPRRVASNTLQATPGDSNVVTIQPVRKTNLFIQAGAFGRFDNANRVRARLTAIGPVKVSSVLVKGRDLFRVRVGPLDDVTDADRMLEAVTRAGYPNARIIVD